MIMDPEFLAGSEHIAHCPVANPTAKQWTYDAELYLVKDSTKYTSSGMVSFTLTAGASDTVDFPITMPGSEGTYKVYLDVYVVPVPTPAPPSPEPHVGVPISAGELIARYQATEDIVIKLPPPSIAIQQFFVVTIPRADKGEYEIHCLIKNTGEAAGTHKVTLYADGAAVESETFTIEPGETYDYVYSWGMAPKGTSGTVWVVGDWGEETPHIRFTAGYSTTAEVKVNCTAVTDTTAILRFAARSVTNRWKVAYCTPPGWSGTEHRGSFTISASGSWTAMWCALTGLLPAHTYEGDISGYDYGSRSGWCEFTTR